MVRANYLPFALGLAPLLIGCPAGNADDDESVDCLALYAAENGYGWENDEFLFYCLDPEGCDPVTPEIVEGWCADDGYPCDADFFITREAAICLAEQRDFDQGIDGYDVNLGYQYGSFHRPAWSVLNIQVEDIVTGDMEGEGVAFHAETGEFLEEWGWEHIVN